MRKGAQAGERNPAHTHGHTTGKFSPEYHSWASMIQRCTNPNRHGYQHYGGKGVKVHPAWMHFEQFLADMGPRPAGTSLDRIDLDGDYAPGNCRWADRTTQARNSKQVVWVEIDGVRRRLVEWCDVYAVSINTVRDRVKHYGMTYAEALVSPRQSQPGAAVPRRAR